MVDIQDERRTRRFNLVGAAARCVFALTRSRDVNWRLALASLVQAIDEMNVPAFDLELVLLRTLSVLDRHMGGRAPTLVHRFLASSSAGAPLTRFRQSVEESCHFWHAGDPRVRSAVALIESRHSQPEFGPRALAQELGLHPSTLSRDFNECFGVNVATFIRRVRLDRAAVLLATTTLSIKEVWAAVGYSHFSNFDRDFKARFTLAPREYRAERGIASPASPPDPVGGERRDLTSPDRGAVLIVDDDLGMRETIGRYLTLEGYRVAVADSGAAGLREAGRVSPQAVLLDYHLPDIDGFECLRQMRRLYPLVGVVIFSADWDLESQQREFAAFGARLLPKLCELVDIGDALATVGSNRRGERVSG